MKQNRPTYTNPTVQRAVKAVQNGEPIVHVAKRECVAYSTVHRWCQLRGIVSTHDKWSAQRERACA